VEKKYYKDNCLIVDKYDDGNTPINDDFGDNDEKNEKNDTIKEEKNQRAKKRTLK